MKMIKNNATSIRVLETLKILSKGSASIQDIVRYFEKTDPNNRIYTNEVILKYLNTLKVFGCRIIKEKDKYVLLNAPQQISLNEKELQAMLLISKAGNIFPEEKINEEINQFLQEIEKRFTDNTRIIAHKLQKPDSINLKYDYNKYIDKIKKYEKYCIDGQRLKITYIKNNRTEESVLVEPIEIKYLNKDAYFSVHNPASAQILDICFDSILEIKQLPLKSNTTSLLSSVAFELKDRLANAYKLHEGEKLLNKKDDGSIIILNQKEDRELLLKRLMKYGDLCEVISPKTLREEMKKLIKETLKNYE